MAFITTVSSEHFREAFKHMVDEAIKMEWDAGFVRELRPRIEVSVHTQPDAMIARLEMTFSNFIKTRIQLYGLSEGELRHPDYMRYHAQRALRSLEQGFFGLWFANVIPAPEKEQRQTFLKLLDSGKIEDVRWVKHPDASHNTPKGYDSLVVLTINGMEYCELVRNAKADWKEVMANILIRANTK